MKGRESCPQRANRSAGNVADYTRLLLRGLTLEDVASQYKITAGAVRKALKAKGLPTNSRQLLAAIPEGCTPTDADVLRSANHQLAQENHELKQRLQAIKAAIAGLPQEAA